MRSKFILIGGCLLIALWAIVMATPLWSDVADDPFRLKLYTPIIERLGFGRVGTTTVAIVEAIVVTVVVALFVALAIKRARTRIKKDPARPVSLLNDIKEKLRTDFPKFSGRRDKKL